MEYDFVEVGLQNGTITYTLSIGSRKVEVTSDRLVADGKWHQVTILREGFTVNMWIDDDVTPTTVQSEAKSVEILESPGQVYIGKLNQTSSLIFD